MTAFFYEYGLFFAKTFTIVLGIAAVLLLVVWFVSRTKSKHREHIEIKKLNDRYDELHHALQHETLPRSEYKKAIKAQKHKHKQERKYGSGDRKKIFVLNFEGDIRASAVTALREEITAVLTMIKPQDEVFVRLESGGGMVHAYGLASSQLMRIRARDIPMTVAVDKIAASGGYMMACVANRIISAPFAVLGSIGVLAQVPNFHRLLKKNDIDFEQFTSGEFKRTVTLFGENTEKARNKFRQEIEDTHTLFKDFVEQNRSGIDMNKVATGEHWYGTRAKELNLVDELKTSDDYLLEQSKQADLYEVKYISKSPISSRVSCFVQQTAEKLFFAWWQQTEMSKYQ